ncbi:Fungalysin/Thermolysin Extracellular metalloproteinase 5 [Phlyctochytrium planicorne]|nr:Fungalysin/Thermolysin Extracellular metalloproteinase 5 [Phlyctochytrium planicorne]
MLSPLRLLVLATALCATLYTDSISAIPTPEPRKGNTDPGRVTNVGKGNNGVPLKTGLSGSQSVGADRFWQPQSEFIQPKGVTPKKGSKTMQDAEDEGFKYIQKQWGLAKSDVEMLTCYKDKKNGLTHMSVVQLIDGIPVANGVANINIDSSAQVISASASLASKDLVASVTGGGAAKGAASKKAAAAATTEAEPEETETAVAKTDNGNGKGKGKGKGNGKGGLAGVVEKVKNVLEGGKGKGNGNGKGKGKGKGKKEEEAELDRRAAEISASDAVVAYAKKMNLKAGKLSQTGAGKSFVVKGAEFALDGADIPANLVYYQTPKGGIEKAWSLQVKTKKDWQNAYISTSTGSILGVSSWVSNSLANTEAFKKRRAAAAVEAPVARRESSESPAPVARREFWDNIGMKSPYGRRNAAPLAKRQNQRFVYNVIPFGRTDVVDNGGISEVVNPADPVASQLGWHDLGNKKGEISTTIGNNVAAFSNFQDAANPLKNDPVVAPDFKFDFGFDETKEPAPNSKEVDTAVSNMFVVANTFHDVMFHFGFDEAAGNFQVKNFSPNGKGGDPVVATSQDGSGFDNANFASPPDGQAGRMKMFLFSGAQKKDGAMENDIIIHELAHGLSNRLTGGPANSNCLNSNLAGGMGEGWSDFFAVAFQMKGTDTRTSDKAVGVFVTGAANGVRGFPYSTNLDNNPRKYSDLQTIDLTDVHTVGEVWGAMLYEVYWNFVDKSGFTQVDSLIANVDSQKGNVNIIKNVVDGFKIQPCNPTFIQARDAIFKADEANFGGANKCEISKGFAKRGLGFSAVDDGKFVDAFDVDPSC